MDYDFQDEVTQDDNRPEKPDLATTLETLQTSEERIASPTLYYGLSGLTPAEVQRVGEKWDSIDPEKRYTLLMELAEASELNFEFDYRELGLFALNDSDANVREAAVELLWEDESLELMSRLIDIAQWDEAAPVRAAAASALGRFILLGEYDEISEKEASRAQDAAISILTNTDEEVDVRRRALEAIANCGHEIVTEAVQEAYDSSEQKMRVSSIFAMGRSYDPKWRETVLREISSADPEMRYEAARAAGELEIKEAVPYLGRMAVNDEREIQEVAVWSLGELGGREALRILSALSQDAEDAGDESLLEAIEDAIGSASIAGNDLDFDNDES
jgi:HEAT repeat protein